MCMEKFKLFDKSLGGIVYGDSTDISYDNTSSKLDAINAQSVLAWLANTIFSHPYSDRFL